MSMTSRTRDELTEQAANAAIEQACRILHLPTIRTSYDAATQSAIRHQASYKTYLADLLAGECDEREARRKIRAVKAACFPRLKHLAEFDFTANPAITPAVVHTLAGGEWIRQGRPLCLIGDSAPAKATC